MLWPHFRQPNVLKGAKSTKIITFNASPKIRSDFANSWTIVIPESCFIKFNCYEFFNICESYLNSLSSKEPKFQKS